MKTKTPSKGSSVSPSGVASTTEESLPSPLKAATVVPRAHRVSASLSSTFSTTTLDALRPAPLVAMVMSGEKRVRNRLSSPAELPPPTTSSRLPL